MINYDKLTCARRCGVCVFPKTDALTCARISQSKSILHQPPLFLFLFLCPAVWLPALFGLRSIGSPHRCSTASRFPLPASDFSISASSWGRGRAASLLGRCPTAIPVCCPSPCPDPFRLASPPSCPFQGTKQ